MQTLTRFFMTNPFGQVIGVFLAAIVLVGVLGKVLRVRKAEITKTLVDITVMMVVLLAIIAILRAW